MKNLNLNIWWGPPKNFSDRKKERKISWLELFYDLAYVAVVSQLTERMAEHPSWQTVGMVFLIFGLLYWSWVNGSQYYDLHGSDGIRTRFFTFLQMIAVIAVAVAIPGVFAGHPLAFNLAFLVIQGIITYLWWSVGYYDPSHRILNLPLMINYSVGFVFLILAVFCPPGLSRAIWVAVLALDITPALIGANLIVGELKKRGEVFTASASLVERFGLFTIIILTECILGTVSGISEVKDRQPAAWAAVGLGMFVAFLLWSLYFDMTSEQETKEGYGFMLWLIYLHYPLLVALSMVGACTKVLLVHFGGIAANNLQWMYCSALSVILLTIFGLTRIMREEAEDRAYINPVSKLLIVMSGLFLLLPVLHLPLKPWAFLTVMVSMLSIPVSVGVFRWARYATGSEKAASTISKPAPELERIASGD